MNSSVISWMSSPPVMPVNPFKSMDESWDVVDNFGDYNFGGGGVVFGHDEQLQLLLHRHEADNYSLQFSNYPDQDQSPIIPTRMNPMHEEHVVGPEMFSLHRAGIAAEKEVRPLLINNNNNNNKVDEPTTKKKARVRPPSQTYDHIIAERRRREQLSQLFVALSALVPGLKKMDKGSVLEDAIKYLKHLKERVQTLEEKAGRERTESALFVKKTIVVVDDDDQDEVAGGSQSVVEQLLPEIEVRACQKHMLIRVHCEKRRGVLVKLLSKVESLHMSVVNTNATPFGNVTVDVTIIAEVEKEFNLTVKEIVIALRQALQQPDSA